MKPEIYNKWEKALDCFEKAEELFKNKEFKQAEEKADVAFVYGMHVFAKLIEDLESSELASKLANIYRHWEETLVSKHYSPSETIEWVRKALNRISEDTPPEAKFRPVK